MGLHIFRLKFPRKGKEALKKSKKFRLTSSSTFTVNNKITALDQKWSLESSGSLFVGKHCFHENILGYSFVVCQLFYPSFLFFCCCRSFVCFVQGHKCRPPLSAELCGATGEPAGSGAAEKTRGSRTGATRTTGAAHIPFNMQQPMEGTIPYFLHRYTYFK